MEQNDHQKVNHEEREKERAAEEPGEGTIAQQRFLDLSQGIRRSGNFHLHARSNRSRRPLFFDQSVHFFNSLLERHGIGRSHFQRDGTKSIHVANLLGSENLLKFGDGAQINNLTGRRGNRRGQESFDRKVIERARGDDLHILQLAVLFVIAEKKNPLSRSLNREAQVAAGHPQLTQSFVIRDNS